MKKERWPKKRKYTRRKYAVRGLDGQSGRTELLLSGHNRPQTSTSGTSQVGLRSMDALFRNILLVGERTTVVGVQNHHSVEEERLHSETEECDQGSKQGGGGEKGGNGEKSSVVGPSRNVSISVTLTDPDVLHCFICFNPLTSPIFQCENGHVACSSCHSNLIKCPACDSPIGHNRCMAIEKILASIVVRCQNSEYGCPETMRYCWKFNHEKTCQYEPCSCPLPDCHFVSSCHRLWGHFSVSHKNSAVGFVFNKVFHITLNIKDEFLFLQEEKFRVLFIINNRSQSLGNVISISCFKWRLGGIHFYDILAKPEGGGSFRFQSSTRQVQNRNNNPPSTGFLVVPPDSFGSRGQLKLELCIWAYGSSPQLNQITAV